MSVQSQLNDRSGTKCELCSSDEDLSVLEVNPSDGSADQCVLTCGTCKKQIEDSKDMDATHWHCLNDSMWSEIPAVQVMAFRLLTKLGNQDLLDMLYLEDDVKSWAKSGLEVKNEKITKDSNGSILNDGDTVTIIKDLEVKGAGFTAKRGTAVRNISLTNNPEQIEGRVNGTRIVLLSKFLKKS